MTAKKDVQVARKKGRGGGEVIWAMPERKHSFSQEVFPNELHELVVPDFEVNIMALLAGRTHC